MDLDPYSEYRYNFLFFLLVLTVFWTFFFMVPDFPDRIRIFGPFGF